MTRKCHVRFGGGPTEKAGKPDLAGGLPYRDVDRLSPHADWLRDGETGRDGCVDLRSASPPRVEEPAIVETNRRLMLPPHELDSFLLTVEDAVDRAREGNAADGYETLLAGLHRAREAETDGEMWAAELVTRYREAVERFAELYGVGRA
jgi:hypothetical protein